MYLFLKLFSKLPLIAIQNIAHFIGSFLYLIQTSPKKTTEINLTAVYPDLDKQARDQLVKKSLQSQMMTYAESIKIWGSSTDFAKAQVAETYGEQILFDAIAEKRGMILVVPHFGTWELMNAWMNQFTSLLIMYKPSDHPDMDRFMLESRQRLNATLVPTDESGVRELFKHLKQGGVTAILPDHIPKPSGGVYAPFYGLSTLSSTLVSKLASKTQCAVIGLSCLRRPNLDGFDIHITALSKDILDRDIQVSVQALNQSMEHMINQAPEQYLWAYKRFRNLEHGKNLYKPNQG